MSSRGLPYFVIALLFVTALADSKAQTPQPPAAQVPVVNLPAAPKPAAPTAPTAAATPSAATTPPTISPPPADVAKLTEELVYRSSLGRGDDVELLLTQGANPNATNEAKIPLISLAASRKDTEAIPVLEALLAHGANVNVKDPNGQTALFYAARSGNKDTVEFLLRKGIDYYSLDNFGDIARTIAFRAERNDIVDMMDNFVKAQSDRVLSLNETVNKLTKEQIEAATETPDQKAAREAKAAAEKAERDRKAAEAKAAADLRAQQQYAANVAQLRSQVFMISYNSCAFQYWSYCQAANQTTELDEQTLNNTITGSQKTVEAVSLAVMQMLNVDQAYIKNIIEGSKTQIYDQLEAIPSRTQRKQSGVGTLADVKKRCDAIANSWQVEPPK